MTPIIPFCDSQTKRFAPTYVPNATHKLPKSFVAQPLLAVRLHESRQATNSQ